jgi:hypothetical protein
VATNESDNPDDLETMIAGVYRGPLEEFVSRRDATVRELRAADRRDDAAMVKGLRKPTRTVWALDAAVLDDPAPVERVASAVVAMIEAQDGKGDVRQASDQLRSTVRELATAAAQAAADAGHHVDSAALVPAVMAVIGDADAFEALRTGRLAEIPTGGGLDVLTGAPPLAAPLAPPQAAASSPEHPEAVAAARRSLEDAEATAAIASQQVTATEQDVSDAEAEVRTADERLRQAEEEARTARARLRQAQQQAKTARQQSRDADRAAAQARAKLSQLADS